MTLEPKAGKVVVIDDNGFSVKVYTNGLLKKGVDVTGFVDPVEGVAFAIENSVQAAAIDLVMEPIDGFEVLNQIKSHNPETICIAMSASASNNDKEKAKEAGFDYLLVKPFDPKELIECIDSIKDKKSDLLQKNQLITDVDSALMRQQLINAKENFNQACIALDPNQIMQACHELRECAVLVKFPSIKASIVDIQKGISVQRMSPLELTNVNQFIQAHLC